jgi:hypothetical protein
LANKYFSNLKPNLILDKEFQSHEVPFFPCDIRDNSIGKEEEMYIALGKVFRFLNYKNIKQILETTNIIILFLFSL